jgi:hypothetical protein
MATYIGNAFSLGMLASFDRAILNVEELTLDRARDWVWGELSPTPSSRSYTSCVGHADTAALFSNLLVVPVPMNRCNVVLEPGDTILVGQYNGPRLPEGATSLPEGASIRWLLCTVVRNRSESSWW